MEIGIRRVLLVTDYLMDHRPGVGFCPADAGLAEGGRDQRKERLSQRNSRILREPDVVVIVAAADALDSPGKLVRQGRRNPDAAAEREAVAEELYG